MKNYFEFAVEKAIDERGISASRSIAHYETWIWLLGDDEFLNEIKNTKYEPYGMPMLIKIGEWYGFDKELIEKLKRVERI